MGFPVMLLFGFWCWFSVCSGGRCWFRYLKFVILLFGVCELVFDVWFGVGYAFG